MPLASRLSAVLRHALFPALLTTLSQTALADLPAEGPALGGASNLAQGYQPRLLRLARSFGINDFRDGMNWALAEKEPQAYVFGNDRLRYPEYIAAAGADLTVTLNWGNPLYDGGDTPHSREAIDAFGAFAGTLVSRFPQISALEIGNEFNGVNFVRGPLAQMTPQERAHAYVPLLEAAATAARAVRPDVRIIGGSTHSMAAGFLWEVLDSGGAGLLDALAIHPYTTPAEQLQRQVAVLRRHPAAAGLPLEMTEFGHPDPAKAPGHLLRNYCQMALSGVSHAVWYPLVERRSESMEPLFSKDGRVTPVGQTYRLIAKHMEGQPAQEAATDPFTYGCRFGTQVLVLWGEPRAVTVEGGVGVLTARGRAAPAPHALSETEPLVFVAPEGQSIDGLVTLEAGTLIADSFDQFAYPQDDEAQAGSDAFARFARQGKKVFPLGTLPGQERGGVPWFPYRGNSKLNPLRLTAESLVPGRNGKGPVEVVHAYTAPQDMTVRLEAAFSVPRRSEDGITVRVSAGGTVIEDVVVTGAQDLAPAPITLSKGDVLEVAVGPNGTARGDAAQYRIRLRRP